MRCVILIGTILVIIGLGCSGTSDITAPALSHSITSSRTTSVSDSHHLWGMWQIAADPASGTLDVIPLRNGEMHVNVIPLLEPPAGAKLKISNLHFDGMICDVDVTLIHPFPGLSQYIGFDVAGIFIANGSLASFSDPDLIMPGPGDTMLLNPDGYTRWWNPSEFAITGQPILRYRDGLLGNKYSTAGFNCTLNGYKLFADDLQSEDDILTLGPGSRAEFVDGSSNTRHYTIDFTGGVVFNYAVDANWEPPAGNPPFDLDDYVPDANRPEAWAISVTEIENSLFNEGNGNLGGDLSLLIDIWDHYHAGLNTVLVESPGSFDPVNLTPIGGSDGYSTYQLDVIDATPKQHSIDLLFSVESEAIGYWDVLPDNPITAYFVHNVYVSLTPTAIPPVAIMEATTPTDIDSGDYVSFDATASTGTPPLTFEWDFDGDGTYGGSEDDYTGDPETPTHTFQSVGTFNVTVKVTNSAGFDISDPVAVHVGLDPDDTYVDGDYTGTDSDGSPAKPFKTIQEGMAAVTVGHKLHVDYLDSGTNVYDTANLSLKSGIQFLGDNWNGGGPGKPKVDNTAQTYTFGMQYGSVTDLKIDGFEIGLGEVVDNPAHYGIMLTGGSNIVISHNSYIDELDDTGLTYGVTMPIRVSGVTNLLVEYNDVGPITWYSETGGEYARVLWGMYFDSCSNTEVKNNFVHDFTIDYYGNGSFEQIRMFCIHAYNCIGIEIHNNLICHIEGLNDYSYRMQPFIAEAYNTSTPSFQFYNNTVDTIDNSTADNSYNSMVGLCIYDSDDYPFTDTWVNNELITNLLQNPGKTAYAYVESYGNEYDITYATAYNITASTSYFSNWNVGDGCVDYPGVNPMYVNNTTSPYDYHFQTGSGCEMGDPNFIDWDDTGVPSGDPDEPSIQNRSRMGCFGGPDGDWDPYDM